MVFIWGWIFIILRPANYHAIFFSFCSKQDGLKKGILTCVQLSLFVKLPQSKTNTVISALLAPCKTSLKPVLCVVFVTVTSLPLYPRPHPSPPPCVVAPVREIWNLTVDPNSYQANVSWKHSFPAGSSEFVLEVTLDSKKPDEPMLSHWRWELEPHLSATVREPSSQSHKAEEVIVAKPKTDAVPDHTFGWDFTDWDLVAPTYMHFKYILFKETWDEHIYWAETMSVVKSKILPELPQSENLSFRFAGFCDVTCFFDIMPHSLYLYSGLCKIKGFQKKGEV